VDRVRLRLLLEYDGTDYSGWQVQPGARTVQGELEDALRRLTGRHVPVTGAGRTDAGVHAAGQVAHMDVQEHEVGRMQTGLDGTLPGDLSVTSVDRVPPGFHARFSAVARTYAYVISRRRHPLRDRYEHVFGGELDAGAMLEAASLSLGENDWRAMSKEGSGNTDWMATVTEATVTDEDGRWTFRITANRFLRGMVRIWTGTLLEIGLGKAGPGCITEMFGTGDRNLAGPSLPARGLTLLKVRYPG
jgi:tRNA pseudouridine38-40 synthase